ncbi:MAG: carbonic anhydrase, partial [Flavobacterium sp.]
MKTKIAILVLIAFSIISCKKHKTVEEKILTSFEQLTEGNQRFLSGKSAHPRQNKRTVLANQDSQKPFAVVITCSDSRVSPEIIFDQGIGDLFVIRNAGNLISDID